MNSIKCHFRWRGEIGIVEESEGRFVFGEPPMSIRGPICGRFVSINNWTSRLDGPVPLSGYIK